MVNVTNVRIATVDGVPEIVEMTISAPAGITTNTLRRITLTQVRAAAAKPRSRRKPRQPLTRPDGTDPEGFSRRVAEAYTEALLTTKTPAKVLAAEAGVPVTTVHRWVRDARRLGLLSPARKGRTGA